MLSVRTHRPPVLLQELGLAVEYHITANVSCLYESCRILSRVIGFDGIPAICGLLCLYVCTCPIQDQKLVKPFHFRTLGSAIIFLPTQHDILYYVYDITAVHGG